MCQSSSPKLPMAVDTAVGWQLPVVIATSPGLRKLGELLWLGGVDTHVISPVSLLSPASVKDERS